MRHLRAFWPAPVAAGALMWAAFAPLDQGWLMPAAWAVLFLSMRARRGEKAGRQALVAALVLFLPGLSWIRPLVWPLWLVVAAWCAMWECLFGWAAGKVLRAGGPRAGWWVVALPALHLLADMLRTTVLTGFPWMLPGYAGWRNPVLIGSADLLGVHGATFATLVLGACAAEAVARRAECAGGAARALVPAAVVWAALGAWAFARPAPATEPGPTVLLLQANIPQQLKEDLDRAGKDAPTGATFWSRQETLAARGAEAAAESGATVDLVVWPETMVPAGALRPLAEGAPLRTLRTDERGRVGTTEEDGRRVAAAARGAQSLAGIMSYAPGERRPLQFNSVVLLDADGRVRGSQDKQHLTPGGEYIPLRGLIPMRERFESYLEEMAGFLPDLQPGAEANVPVLRGGRRVGVLVCYESLFPEIPREMVRRGADLVVNCSNYGWFAGTAQMDQALAIACFRAAELRRAVVLASNNGISAVIGPSGRAAPAARGGDAVLPADVDGFLLARAPVCREGTVFAAAGEWGAWAAGLAGLVAATLLARRPRPT